MEAGLRGGSAVVLAGGIRLIKASICQRLSLKQKRSSEHKSATASPPCSKGSLNLSELNGKDAI